MHTFTTEGIAGFSDQPESVVQAEGLEAVFECLYPGAVYHSWGINGEFLFDDQFPPNVTRVLPSGDSPARLIIPAIPQYNNTVVQCEAIVRAEGGYLTSVLSCTVILLVQGYYQSKFHSYRCIYFKITCVILCSPESWNCFHMYNAIINIFTGCLFLVVENKFIHNINDSQYYGQVFDLETTLLELHFLIDCYYPV